MLLIIDKSLGKIRWFVHDYKNIKIGLIFRSLYKVKKNPRMWEGCADMAPMISK